MKKLLCVLGFILAQLQELKAMDGSPFWEGIKSFFKGDFWASSPPPKRADWQYDPKRFKNAKDLVTQKFKENPRYFDEINHFLALPEDDKAKTWILRMLRNRMPEYYESLEDVLRAYQSYFFFLEISSQDISPLENYLYFMCHSDFKDYKKIFKDENRKTQEERYNYHVFSIKLLCNGDNFFSIENVIKVV